MGVCQSIGGAATSGKGFTGVQIAQVLQKAAFISDPTDADVPLVPEYVSEIAQQTFTPAGGAPISVELFAPKFFARVRKMENISATHFSTLWNLPESECQLAEGGGRSMAMFLQSLNGTYLMKTIAEAEANVLLGILDAYVKHLETYNDSFIMRYLMLLRIKCEEEVGYIVVFLNVFDESGTLTEKWDLKGRYPKPTKYEEAIAEYTGGNSASVKVPLRKDKHLQRAFYLRHELHNAVLEQLHRDFYFLRDANLMDYSVLIGVQRADPASIFSVSTPVDGAEDSQTRNATAMRKALSRHHGGIPSLDCCELFFIGIIDALTFYNGKKKTANFFKTFLWKEESLSTIPPDVYCDRIEDFTKIIFPAPLAEWGEIEQRFCKGSFAALPQSSFIGQ
eukprot:PhM_4_TR17537/c0_g1_i1/m.15117/K00889/PIP5K; 1-phosphatidylinositol-4-phosphate 5-kinase